MFVERNKVRLDSQTLQKDVHFYHAKFERFFAHNLPWLSCGWFTHKPLIYQFIFICKSSFFFELLVFYLFRLVVVCHGSVKSVFLYASRAVRGRRFVCCDRSICHLLAIFRTGVCGCIEGGLWLSRRFRGCFGWFGRGESNQEVDSLKLCAANDAKINSRRFSVKWPKAAWLQNYSNLSQNFVFYVRIAHKTLKCLKISNSDVFGEMTHDKKTKFLISHSIQTFRWDYLQSFLKYCYRAENFNRNASNEIISGF